MLMFTIGCAVGALLAVLTIITSLFAVMKRADKSQKTDIEDNF